MRGGRRPGAGRPKGSRDSEPRKPLPAGVTIWGRVHQHVADVVEREAAANDTTPSALIGALVTKRYRCRCPECLAGLAELRRRAREAARG